MPKRAATDRHVSPAATAVCPRRGDRTWHATLYTGARGFTTGLVPDGPGGIELSLDLINHEVVGRATDGRIARFSLEPMSVAFFHGRALDLIRTLGGTPEFHGRPNEIPEAIPFAEDRMERPYDANAVTRFFRACVAVTNVLQIFRTAYLGKVSPVHLFWGSFDIAVTRFSGRHAPHIQVVFRPCLTRSPARPTGTKYRQLASGQVGAIDFPAFYSYAYPMPTGFAAARISPEAAYYDENLGEFLLPYDAVRLANNPEDMLMTFLESTYRAAAELGDWDRAALECSRSGRTWSRQLPFRYTS